MRGQVIDQLRTAALTAGVDALRAAASAGTDPVAVAIVGWELIVGGHPALTAKRKLQLWRSARCADRCAAFGQGQTGAGALLLLDLMEGHKANQQPWDEPVFSLGYFVCELRQIARHWRRSHKGLGPVRDTGQRDRSTRAWRDNENRRRDWKRGRS